MKSLFKLALIAVLAFTAFAAAESSVSAKDKNTKTEKVKLTKEEKKLQKLAKKREAEIADSIKEANARWLDYGNIELHYQLPGMTSDAWHSTMGYLQVRFGKKTTCKIQFKGQWYDAEPYRFSEYQWRFKEGIELRYYYFNIPNDLERTQPNKVYTY